MLSILRFSMTCILRDIAQFLSVFVIIKNCNFFFLDFLWICESIDLRILYVFWVLKLHHVTLQISFASLFRYILKLYIEILLTRREKWEIARSIIQKTEECTVPLLLVVVGRIRYFGSNECTCMKLSGGFGIPVHFFRGWLRFTCTYRDRLRGTRPMT